MEDNLSMDLGTGYGEGEWFRFLPPLTSCCAARLPTAHRLLLVQGWGPPDLVDCSKWARRCYDPLGPWWWECQSLAFRAWTGEDAVRSQLESAFGSIPSLLMNVALGRFEVSKCFPFRRWEDDLVLPGCLMISVSIDHVQYLNQEASLGQLFRTFFVEHGVLFCCTHSILYSYQGLKKRARMNTFLCVPPASGSLIFWCWVTFAVSACFIFSLLVASVTWVFLLCTLTHSKDPLLLGGRWGWNPIVGVSN